MKTTFGSEPPLGGTKARVAFDIFEAGGVQLEDFQPNFKLGAENLWFGELLFWSHRR